MAVVSHLGTATWTTAAGNKTVTATPAAGTLIVVVAPATGVATSAVSDNNADGLGAYTKIGSSFTGFSTAGNLSIWVRNAVVGSGTSTVFTATQASSTGGGLDLFQVTGMTLTGSSAVRSSGGQSTGTLGTTPAPVLSVPPLSGNPVIGAVCNGTNPAGLTQRGGYTEASDLGYITPATGLETMFLSSGETSQTITWGGNSATAFASIAIELDTTGTSGPPVNSAGQPAGVRVILQRTGSAFSTPVTVSQVTPPPPAVPAAFRPFTQAVRARRLPAGRGRVYGNPGAPLRNPGTGPVFSQADGPVQGRRPLPSRGRISKTPVIAVQASPVPAVFRQSGKPARAVIPGTWSKGRVYSGPGAPVRNPGTGPQIRTARAVRAQALPKRAGYAQGASNAVQNPTSGPVFRQATQPARARRPLPPRGRTWSNPGAPVFIPPPFTTGPVFNPRHDPARIRPSLPPRGRAYGNPGAPVRNASAGPVFRQFTQPAQAKRPLPPRGRVASNPGIPVIIPPGIAPFRQATQPAKARQPLPVRGRAWSDQGAPVRNPGTGAAFPAWDGPIRARQPLPPHGRTATRTGVVVILTAGVRLYPLQGPVRGRIPQNAPRGRAGFNAGAPVHNPATGPAFRQATAPIRARQPLPPRGRVSSNAGAPVFIPPPPVSPATIYPQQTALRARQIPARPGRAYRHAGVRSPDVIAPRFSSTAVRARQLPARPGRVSSNQGAPVIVPAPFRQATQVIRARQPLPIRGRVSSGQGAPVVIITPARFFPKNYPARVRPVLPPRGRVYRNPGVQPRNPTAGPRFIQAVRPARAVIPQNAPRGRTAGNPGGPVQNIPQLSLRLRLGGPYTGWETDLPYTGWVLGGPDTGWDTADPYI